MYSKIVNPKTGRKVSTKSKLGQSILRNYINLLTRAAPQGFPSLVVPPIPMGASKPVFIRDFLPIMDAEWPNGPHGPGSSIPWTSLAKLHALSSSGWSGRFGDLTIAHFKTDPHSVFINAASRRGILKNFPWLGKAEQDLKNHIINSGF